MVWKDLFLVKKIDLELFRAPQFFKREPEDGNNYHIGYRAAHKHSYLALSHMMAFTDTQNLFQRFAHFPRVSIVILSLILRCAGNGRLRGTSRRCRWELSGPSWPY